MYIKFNRREKNRQGGREAHTDELTLNNHTATKLSSELSRFQEGFNFHLHFPIRTDQVDEAKVTRSAHIHI